MKKELIKLKGISKNFAGVRALEDVDMVILEGETRCLAGENGGGKSTLIKIISGFYTPDEGTVEINGKKFSNLTPRQAIDEGIQIIYQDFAVFPNLSVAENIALASERIEGKKLVHWKSIKEKAKRVMSLINISIDPDALLGELPVADKQLVAICRALSQDAKLLIMDEPTTALTKKEVASLFGLVRELQARGIAILFISHKLEEVFEIAEELTILRNGKKVIEGSMKDFDSDKFIYYMTGRKIEQTAFGEPEKIGKRLLKADKIGIKSVFKDVSFDLHEGEIVGITGLLGSGRSELAKALFGLERLTEGNLYIEDEKVKLNDASDAIRRGIAYVPEDRLTEGLFMPHSITKNTISASLLHMLSRMGFIKNKYITEKVDEWIEELKIVTPSQKLPVQSLSGGNQQKVVLAKWLTMNPKILILNCPTVGVDIGAKTDIHLYARQLAKKGMGVIIISDDIPEVLNNCNRFFIMKKGYIIGEYDVNELDGDALSSRLSEA